MHNTIETVVMWIGLITLAIALGGITACMTYILTWYVGQRRKFARARIALEKRNPLEVLPTPLGENA